MKYPLVKVWFEDICTDPGWHSFPVVFGQTVGTIVGYLIHEDGNHIVLASGFIDEEYGDQTVIPLGLVRRRAFIEEPT